MSSHPSQALKLVSRTSSTEDLIPEASTPLHRAGAVREKTPSRISSSAASMTAPATTSHLARAEATTTPEKLPIPKRLEKIAKRTAQRAKLDESTKKILLISTKSNPKTKMQKYAAGSDYVTFELKNSLANGMKAGHLKEYDPGLQDWQKLTDEDIDIILQDADTRFQENTQLLDDIQSRGVSSDLSSRINQYKAEKSAINAAQIITELKTELQLVEGSFWHHYANTLEQKIEDAQRRNAASNDGESTV